MENTKLCREIWLLEEKSRRAATVTLFSGLGFGCFSTTLLSSSYLFDHATNANHGITKQIF